MAVPVFIAVLSVLVLAFGGVEHLINPRRPLLVLHAPLLAACLGLGRYFGPFARADSPAALRDDRLRNEFGHATFGVGCRCRRRGGLSGDGLWMDRGRGGDGR
jgi:hypothetical protein